MSVVPQVEPAAAHAVAPPMAPSAAAAEAAPRLALVHDERHVARLAGISVRRGGHLALDGLDLTLPAGRLVAVVGPNGAGKSTLLELLAGRLAPSRGRLELSAAVRGAVGWLPQRSTLDTSFPMSVLDTALMGHWHRLGAFGRARREHVEQALAVLERVGLADARRRLIGELSVGQLQRLLFARLALQDARLVLLDEPFAAVDEATADLLLRELEGWRDAGRSVVVVTHDLAPVRERFDHAVLLARRLVAAGAPATALTAESLDAARRAAWALT